ncbi:MAG: FHA domain-containing protein [Candidatus Schekmanbacteria bacterium]|nr:FHA domain-containing protein [Candidatus Schekmanbacteria bacterium]
MILEISYQWGKAHGTIALEAADVTIGRDPGSSVEINHPCVSRHHAVLQRQAESWLLVDQSSRNGTWVNGLRIAYALLNIGDEIFLGDFARGSGVRMVVGEEGAGVDADSEPGPVRQVVYYLECRTSDAVSWYPLRTGEVLLIGRDGAANLAATSLLGGSTGAVEACATVAPRHAMVRCDESSAFLTDLLAPEGTFLAPPSADADDASGHFRARALHGGGSRRLGPGESVALSLDSVFSLGRAPLRFTLRAAEAGAQTRP